MGCFSLAFLENLLIWAIVVLATIAVLKILVPWVLSLFGAVIDARLMQIINIIVGAIIAIYIVIIVFSLLSCLWGSGGGLRLPTKP